MKILVINIGGNNRRGGVPGLRNTGSCVCSDERRRRAAEHSAVPFPTLDDCRELSGGDLSEPPVLIGCMSGARAGTPRTLDGLDHRHRVRDHEVAGKPAILAEEPSSKHPETSHRMEIIELSR